MSEVEQEVDVNKEHRSRIERFRELSENFSVIRLKPNTKRPLEKDWSRYCEIKRSFDEIGFHEGDNAGIACGPASGLLVLDLDDEDAFQAYCLRNGVIPPPTLTVRTWSGKLHFYYRYPENGKVYGSKAIKKDGFDIRGMGGMVVAPGSVHPDTGKQYYFENDLPIEEAPQWLLDLAAKDDGKVKKVGEPREVPREADFPDYPPINVETLPLSGRVKRLIKEGKERGKRSEAIWEVLLECLERGLTERQILSVFTLYPIGQKYHERGPEWLRGEVQRAEEYLDNPRAVSMELRRNPPRRAEGEKGEEYLEWKLNTPFNDIAHGELSLIATGNLFNRLQSYGTILGKEQKEALWELVCAYTWMAQGRLKGRCAYPLPTGAGKTQSIVAWIARLNELGKDHIGVAVGQYKVEALCSLKRDLMDAGVPEDRIGLIHSYQYDEEKAKAFLEEGEELPPGYASLPCTDHHTERQFLLVTHNRVRGPGDIAKYNEYRGKARDIFIWDEAFFSTSPYYLSRTDFASQLGWLEPRVELDPRLEPLVGYLKKSFDALEALIQMQRDEVLIGPGAVMFNPLPLTEIRRFKELLGNYDKLETLRSLLDLNGYAFRIVSTEQGVGIVTYDLAIPQEIQNVIILDASFNIRELQKMDPSIRKAAYYSDHAVSYENVTVHQLRHPSGRHSMTKEFSKKRREDRLVSLEITEVVKEIPEDEGVIILTFKKRKVDKVDFKEILEMDLRAAGVDTEALIEVRGKEKPRFVWLTWGNETSLSQHSYCANVIFAGVLHRSTMELAASAIAQTDDMLYPLDHDALRNLRETEITHCLYQAMSRGSCRILQGNVTRPMNVWLIYPSLSIKDRLNEVMPGFNRKRWKTKHMLMDGKIEELAEQIEGCLRRLDPSIERISLRRLKEHLRDYLETEGLPAEDPPRTTFRKSRDRALELMPDWEMVKASLVRTKAMGFPLEDD
jgi:hypothetical protein